MCVVDVSVKSKEESFESDTRKYSKYVPIYIPNMSGDFFANMSNT